MKKAPSKHYIQQSIPYNGLYRAPTLPHYEEILLMGEVKYVRWCTKYKPEKWLL